MNSDSLNNRIACWTSLGALFNTDPASGPIDLERLPLDTARDASGMSRLFIMAATWLHTYGELVETHRLKRLVHDELEAEFRPVLGLLVDIAQHGKQLPQFQIITESLRQATSPMPLFTIERTDPQLIQRAERNASAISKSWNLWCVPFEFKHDAIRPLEWLMKHHPELFRRENSSDEE